MGIKFVQKGDFRKSINFLEKIKETVDMGALNRYGEMGVKALQDATPKDTGETAKAWTYKIRHEFGRSIIEWHNTNEENGALIAILIQYGHASGGGFVQANDFINPAMKPVFEKIANDAWKEVSRG